MGQFSSHQAANQQSQRLQIESALRSSAGDLKQLASIVASSESLSKALEEKDREGVAQSLKYQWPTIQLEAGVDDLKIIGLNGRPVASYGDKTEGSSATPDTHWLAHVIANEQPGDFLRCQQVCRQYAAVPILSNGSNAGIVMVSRSLIEVMSYFMGSSGNDIALILNNRKKSFGDEEERWIPDWGAYSLAVTHKEKTLPIIKSAAKAASLESIMVKPVSIFRDGENFEVSLIPIGKSVPNLEAGYFASVENVSKQLSSIQTTTRTVFVVALAGWGFSEVLLLFVLWKPVQRIRALTEALPGLATGDYTRMRSALSGRRGEEPRDEIDVLVDSALSLATQLESLEEEVHQRGEKLESQVLELRKERDLIGNLMNAAQVLVVIHDDTGTVQLANRYAGKMVGQDEHTLEGAAFREVFYKLGNSTDSLTASFGQRESELMSQDGQLKTIVWHHTALTEWAGERQSTISVGLDITDRKIAEMRLSWLANRDPLTELYNRRYFEKALQQAVLPGARGAMLYMDLDRFKEVNELGGHQAGDQLLKLVSETLRREFGSQGVFARLGGDEFAVLLERSNAEAAVGLAKLMSEKLENISLDVDGQRHRTAASIGIALYPDHGPTPKELMASADFAMYKAKEHVSSRWHLLASSRDRDVLQERLYWEEKLRHALKYEGFELWHQPIAKVTDSAVSHYEILLRMRIDDDEGQSSIISPGAFIPIAEKSGLIVDVDRWVLTHSLKLINRLRDPSLKLAVNLSAQSLRDETLTRFLKDGLIEHRVSPSQLIVEVTETAAVTDFSTARCILQEVRDMGCSVALDDFGVGFSSFYYLDQLPADYIKIDGSFVQDLPDSRRSQVIVKAVVEIARGFGKKTVAEFVDRPEIVDMLRESGVDYMQGYWLGRPTSFDIGG
ncbi:hypothetical protein GCM10009038_15600 [Salinicola rhizosphaerae]|uniref:EAL domain-containing protein n=2 Tax=Salinicola rhizosphaerae TaxID=1443141 RepID=A0ABQ3DVF8_9GAMM|nr:hypothetical protein GCM10009038_15600 [Salinicola rhizosphaerae]